MIWLVLTGTYMAGVIAGVALVLWAEKVNEKPYSSKPPPKQQNRNGTTDSITSNHTHAP